MTEQGGEIAQADRVGAEVVGAVVPCAVTVESRARSACVPKFIIVFQVFFCGRILVMQYQ